MTLLKTPGDATSFRIYVDNISTATIVGASIAADESGLTYGSCQQDNTTTPKSVVVPVTGGSHGQRVQAQMTVTLSSGGPIVRPVAILIDASI